MTSSDQGRKHLTFQMLFATELFHYSVKNQRPACEQHVSAVNSSMNNFPCIEPSILHCWS